MTVSRTMVVTATMLALGAALGGVALAQSASASKWVLNPNAPVDVAYDGEGVFNAQNCTSVLKGNVEVTQDRIRLRARTLTTYNVKRGGGCGAINRLEAESDVYYVTPLEAVRADRAVYDLTTDRITFTGGVILTRGENVATSDSVTINLKTNDAQLKGKARAVFYPNRPAQ